jgi:SGNH domain (fused to AT3 domains)
MVGVDDWRSASQPDYPPNKSPFLARPGRTWRRAGRCNSCIARRASPYRRVSLFHQRTSHLMVGGYAKELMGGGVLRKETSVAEKRFYESANKLIASLIKSGKQVVFVLDVPDLPFNPKSCFSRPIALLQKRYDPCNQDRYEYEKRTEGYSKMIADVISSSPGLKVVDPKAALCDQKFCWAMKDNRLLYHDRHRLSAYGADLVVKSILAQQSSTVGQN